MTQPLDAFTYLDGVLHAGEIPVSEIADAVGTPTFVYSAEAIRANYQRIERAFAPLGAHLHYAVKASSNLHLLRLLHEQGAGMDVVSGGEMERAWLAGTPMRDIVFAGVGKTEAEQRAALDGQWSPLLDDAERLGGRNIESRGPVGLFNVESESELEVLARVAAELGVVARACLRVNPDVDARTHEYTTTGLEENKFGVSWKRVPEIFGAFRDVASVELVGLHVHIGSPVREIEPYESAVKVLLRLIDTLEADGHAISVLDLGGGWPMNYTDGQSHGIEPFAEALIPLLEERVKNGLQIVLEPGRSILANSGVLLTRVQHVKVGRAKTFVICDAGMHTLIRPAFYRAFHFAWPALSRPATCPRRPRNRSISRVSFRATSSVRSARPATSSRAAAICRRCSAAISSPCSRPAPTACP